jgi:toxin ParE1/3/4
VSAPDFRIEWRPLAIEDLRAIVSYIGKSNPRRAQSFGKELHDKTAPLAQHAELGRPGRLPGIRELIAHPNYIIFYRVLSEARTVQILRVKHAAQKFP